MLRSPAAARLDPRKLLLSIAKNPFIIAILLGLAAQLSGISFPPFASKSIDYLADMSTPLALLAVGGQFDPKKAAGNLRLNLTICTLRLVVIPAVVIAVAAALGFRGPELAFIFVVVGSPSAVSGAALAKVMGSDHQLTRRGHSDDLPAFGLHLLHRIHPPAQRCLDLTGQNAGKNSLDSEYIFLPKLKQILGFLQKRLHFSARPAEDGAFLCGLGKSEKVPVLTRI